MNLKTHLIVAVASFLAAGFYVTFFSGPAHKDLVAKLQTATTNEVFASLGQPYRIVDAATFTARADEMAREGYPVSNADMTARGMVWLYADGGIKNTAVRKYQAVFFDGSNRVAAIYGTAWMKDPWGVKR